MQLGDSGEFTRRLVALGELFEANLTPVKQAIYFEALRDVPFPAVAAALNAAARTCPFMPKPAEIRKLAVGDDEDQAERAWLAWKSATRRAGHMASLVLDDPALAETIVAVFGSWAESCAVELSPEMWTAKRKEFGRVYRVLCDRALTGSRYLAGEAEHAEAVGPVGCYLEIDHRVGGSVGPLPGRRGARRCRFDRGYLEPAQPQTFGDLLGRGGDVDEIAKPGSE